MSTTEEHKVRLPTLGSDNYSEWAVAIQTWLEAKELWELVEGTMPMPKPDDSTSQFKKWKA